MSSLLPAVREVSFLVTGLSRPMNACLFGYHLMGTFLVLARNSLSCFLDFLNSHNFMKEKFPPFIADKPKPRDPAQLTDLEAAAGGLFASARTRRL